MQGDFLKLTTDANLLSALRNAKNKKPSARELLEQRVSFVLSTIGSDNGATREDVRKAILKQGGLQSAESAR